MRRGRLDPVTVEVMRGGLVYAAEEMGVALRNSAYSPNIKERMDHSCAVFDGKGRMAAQAEHIPAHLGSMPLTVKAALRRFDDGLEPGDMVLLNDPYAGGTHLPDLTLIAPVLRHERLIAYVVNKAHHSDVGGITPGSMAAESSELYQEGLVIPPVKLVVGESVNQDVMELILRNVRTPRDRLGDLRAQIAANRLGAGRILELAERYGAEGLEDAMDRIMGHSTELMQREISKIPEGVYEAEDVLELPREQATLKMAVSIEVEGDHLTMDFTGTDSQVEIPINAPLGVTLAACYYVVKCVTDPTIPSNDGCYRPVSVEVPEGSVLNPKAPAPVAGGQVETGQRIVDVLFRALAQALPDRVPAASQGTMNNVTVGSYDPITGEGWSFYETIGGGMGARPGLDGIDSIHTHMTNTMNTPIEVIERNYPIRVTRYELRPDSSGAGEWRGGAGTVREWVLTGGTATVSVMAERNSTAPWGLLGGRPGVSGEYWITSKDGTEAKIPSKCTVRLSQGEGLRVLTPGGGGLGAPSRRDRKLVRMDVLSGILSREKARLDYGP